MCRVLGVSTSGYHAWRNRKPSRRACYDEVIMDQIRTFHTKSRGTYGTLRIHADLIETGIQVSRKRVARLMRQAGLKGVSRRKGIPTTLRDREARPAS